MSAAPVMILAGGTGGHVFPALAVAEALAAHAVPVVWMGTARGLESRVVPAAGITLEPLSVRGLRGKGRLGWLTAPLMLARALFQALAVLRRHRPRAVLGMGGYVAGPGAVAAWLLRRPLVIHEQNAIPGFTNRHLARLARAVLTGFDRPFPGAPAARFVGNPVRRAIAELPPPEVRMAGREGPLQVLVVGGSLGALALNRAVPAALAALPAGQRPRIRHQAGERTQAVADEAYASHGVDAEVVAFIEDMAEAYAWADLVICRAGALTVSELAAAGVAALFVPFPHAVDDHQAANAAFLVDAGAAEMVREAEIPEGRLEAALTGLLGDRAGLLERARRARALGRPQAAEMVAQTCLEVAP
ncbi:undecaprenyldiphospho-muramoylpentapeptide beta-N-acetylglucosaminyltransferase [Sediminicurvatus halobius]|uniref:UDP-N-acetylglucosamine--N-acetylmuramyl-(pentapeptide) pyrophosphoryl-undecaprenol N-acetylglucosamine transferase n=1 Tax=Sediminicurvatus halobius TaxID=2182432 RepID=A0A2U2N7L1_9GAMM|nr:undecaprenyldiphospho-muramoylpentapeptide beta-N-acetylglucosaminyltransferase [Spiribacter halobius]PWG65175.1 undecaprenyldiphospho-muramoylpentapeptide beta-N-acetylglucosaminyltransferase [Spiribacter halobius]UEX78874.1 undecaprenyldiphospho-muramoylpentapeptide beta-N-acetylglucosaminyltransferase [Spiribacter halobius]